MHSIQADFDCVTVYFEAVIHAFSGCDDGKYLYIALKTLCFVDFLP